VTIIGANGHYHSRGKQFEMFTWDGRARSSRGRARCSTSLHRVGRAADGDLDNELAQVPANGGVFYTCEYQWTPPEAAVGCEGLDEYDQTKYMTPENLDCCYTFGPIVEKNEHCNIFVYYYPKAEGDVSCI
jgi:hypothetical protein